MRRFEHMKKEYDFSTGPRGKFYRKGERFRLPIYLDAHLQNRLRRMAKKNHEELNDIVERLLKREIHLSIK